MTHFKTNKLAWERQYSTGKWDYLDSSPIERSRSAIIGMYCRHFFPEGIILDIGCGLGTVIDFLNNIQQEKYTGIDISQEALKKAAMKKATFINIDFNEFNSKEKFDIIIFNEVLNYLDEEFCLKKALDLLSKDGKAIISLYTIKNKSSYPIIWEAAKKIFNIEQRIDISSTINMEYVTWEIGILGIK